MHNTIILWRGSAEFRAREWLKTAKPGDAIFGIDTSPAEVNRWPIDQEAAAWAALAECRSEYTIRQGVGGPHIFAEEWALEWCECDEDGDFVEGSDYEVAPAADLDTAELAAELYDAGWRADDRDHLARERALTPEQADAVCKALDQIADEEG